MPDAEDAEDAERDGSEREPGESLNRLTGADGAGASDESVALRPPTPLRPLCPLLTFTDPARNCAPIDNLFAPYGYPSSPSSVKFPVKAGYTVAAVGVFCTPKFVATAASTD